MIVVRDIEQMGPEWFEAKLGTPSASHFDCINPTKGQPSKSAQGYMYRLAYERITGRPASDFMSYDMRRGVENEPTARALYELLYDVDVEQVALCYPDERKRWGCSPDGLIGKNGGLEIKDAKPEVQIDRLLNGWSKANHFQQINGNMLITGRRWWDRMSHCPGLSARVDRYERDDKFCAALKVALDEFCDKLDAVTEKLRGMG